MEAVPVIMLVVNLFLLIWVVINARQRGASALAWGITVALLGPLGWLLYLIARPRLGTHARKPTAAAEQQTVPSLYEGSGRIYFTRGNYHYAHDQLQKAIKNYLQFLSCTPTDDEALWTVYNNIECSFRKLGDEPGAEACKALWKRDSRGHDHPVLPVCACLTTIQAVRNSEPIGKQMDNGLRRLLEKQNAFEHAG